MFAPLTLDAPADAAPAARPRAASNGSSDVPVAERQRLRILSAMVEACYERNLESVNVKQIIGRAGVSRRTFYELFEDRGDCFLGAFDEAVRQASPTIVAAYESERAWVDRVRAGLRAMLAFLDGEPQLARLCVVTALVAGPASLARRAQLLKSLAAVVDQGPAYGRAAMSPLTAESVVGGVFAVIHARLLPANPRPLSGLLNQLMAMIALPYLGAARARKELTPPSNPAARPPARSAAPPARSPRPRP